MLVTGVEINAATALTFFQARVGDVDPHECLVNLEATIDRVHGGDLRAAEALLTAQATTLNMLFTHLATLAQESDHLDTFDRYLKLALRSQNQCRATLQTLAEIKQPPTTLVTRQANIANGPQQVVNNTISGDELGTDQSMPTDQSTSATRTVRGS